MIEARHGLLRQLVETYGPSGQEQEISYFCQNFLQACGFEVETVDIGDGRQNVLATKNRGVSEKAIGFYGHLDTVHPEPDKWDPDKPALQMTRIGDRYYGLGTSDMRSGVWAIIEGLADTDKYVKALLTVDEEEISTGAWEILDQRPDFLKDIDLLISAEAESSQGGNAITVGRPGRQVYEATFIGVGTHLMHQEQGIDAIKLNACFQGRFYDLVESGAFLDSPYSKAQIRRVFGESIGMSVPALAGSEIEILQGAEDPAEIIHKMLASIIGEHGTLKLKNRLTPYLPGYHTKDFPYQAVINQIVRNHTGKDAELYVRPSVGDENVFATVIPKVITWGPTGGNEHTANEFVEIDSLDRTVAMYRDFLSQVGKQND